MKTVNHSAHQRQDCELASHLAHRKVQAASWPVFLSAASFLSVFRFLLLSGDGNDERRLIETDKLLELRFGKVGGLSSRAF